MDKAVALKYDLGFAAPLIVASGHGELAERITRIAREHGVTCTPAPAVAEGLVDVPVGSLIPEQYYQVVAELLVFARGLGHETD